MGKGAHTSKLTRRGFLRTSAVATAVAAAAGVPLQALAESAADSEAVLGEQKFVNTCRGNCGGNCALVGTVREGKLVQARPYEVPEGFEEVRFGCVKGNTSPQRLYATNRVLYPLKLVGERGSGEYERISWEEAIDTIATKIQEAQRERDADFAIWTSYGSFGYLNGAQCGYGFSPRDIGNHGLCYERFMRKTGGTWFGASGDQAQQFMQYCVTFFNANSMSDLLNAKTIINWGCNPPDASRNIWPWFSQAHSNGVKTITIDPQYTVAAAQSDIWAPIRPGTDGALMLAMANYALENGHQDDAYLANGSVAPLLVKEDGSYLRLSDLGQEPVMVMTIMGVEMPEDSVVVFDAASDMFGSCKLIQDPVLSGTWEVGGHKVRTVFDVVREHTKEYTLERAAEICDLPLEKVTQIADLYCANSPSTIISLQGFGHHYNSWHNYKDMLWLASVTGNINKVGASVFQSPFGSMMPQQFDISDFEIENPKPFRNITGMLLPQIQRDGAWDGQPLDVKMLLVANANPIASDSGREELIEAFGKVPFVVCADPFMTDTALQADIVLPIAMSWEQTDFFKIGFTTFMMQQAVEPAGECKSDIDIFRLLSDKLGYDDLYDKTNEEYLRAHIDTPSNIEAGKSYDDYMEKGAILDYTDVPAIGFEYNALGRTIFYVDVMPVRDSYATLTDDASRCPHWEPPIEAYAENPKISEYPFYGCSEHNNYTAHSNYNNIPWLEEVYREPFVKINTQAAAEKGISQGDYVRVWNDRGEAVLRAVVTPGIRRDTLLLPHGWQSADYVKGHHQSLTLCAPCPVTGNSPFNDFLCNVEKYEDGGLR